MSERGEASIDEHFAALMAQLGTCGCAGAGHSAVAAHAAKIASDSADGPAAGRAESAGEGAFAHAGSGTRGEAAADLAGLPSACGEVLDHIFELLDQALPSELERMMREHSAHCEHCGPAVTAEMRLREVIRRSCSEEAPASLRARVTAVTAKYHC